MPPAQKPPVTRRVWRITEGEPSGQYVDAGTAPAPKLKPVDERHSGWAVSSFELKYGLDVSEADDTVPAELFDTLFKPPPA